MNLIYAAYLANQVINTQPKKIEKKKKEEPKVKEVSKSESTNKDKDETKGQNVDISV